jgi:toxin FitB
MAWLLDTNILSEIRRLKPEPKGLAFVAAHPLDELYIAATLAELRFGIELLSENSSSRAELNTIRPLFDKRVLPITEQLFPYVFGLVAGNLRMGFKGITAS